jgi:Tfp pilus assembly protein PilV
MSVTWAPPPEGQSGLTIAELLIAAAILAVAMLGIAGMVPRAYQNIGTGGQITKAANLAREKMEELKNASYAALLARGTSYADSQNPIEGVFTRTWTIEEGGLPAGLKRITVTVGWSTLVGVREVQVMTLVTR